MVKQLLNLKWNFKNYITGKGRCGLGDDSAY